MKNQNPPLLQLTSIKSIFEYYKTILGYEEDKKSERKVKIFLFNLNNLY